MSKTIELQIEKSQTLIEGFNRNIAELRSKGVRDESLNAMSNDLVTLKKINDECDALREDLSVKVKEMNVVLKRVRMLLPTTSVSSRATIHKSAG